jgi:dsRNA-specific ribonuclease
VAAIVDSKRIGEGIGRSKKAAEQAAAEQALKRLGA